MKASAEFGAGVRKLRHLASIGIRELATLASTGVSCIQRIEKGQNCELRTADKVAAVFGRTVDEVIILGREQLDKAAA